MSRRRARRTFKRRATAAGAGLGLFAWAWQTHPLALALTLTAATVAAAVGLYNRRARQRERLTAPDKPTVVYQHRFRRDLIQPYLDRGYDPDWFGYTGITNDYEARCGQHEKASWWWILIDPALSTFESNRDTGGVTWPNAYAAGLVETALIQQRCGLGNTRDNPAWRRQTPVRESLQAYAHQLHAQTLAYGRTG